MFLQKIDKSTNFKDILLKFSINDIREMIDDPNIFARGNSYNKRDFVSNVIQSEENRVKAQVLGSSNNSYDVDIYRRGGSLHSECNCPYGDICKHVVATFINISQTKTLKFSMVLSHQDKVLEHLQTLFNSELIELVIKFAPDSFIKEIILNDAPSEELNVRINEIASSIEMDLNDEDLLYNPERFQKNISAYMENLKPFVNKNPDKVFEIVFDLAEQIESLQEEGYLYIDRYYDEEYFDFDTLASEIMLLIERVTDKKKQLEIFMESTNIARGYMSITYDSLEVEDKRVFLDYFDEDSSVALYGVVEEFLSFEEREKFLLNQSPNWIYNLVVEFYLEHDKKELAVAYIEGLLKEEFCLDYIEKIMEITEVSKERLKAFILQAMENGGYRDYDFILKYIDKIEEREEVELLLKEKTLDCYYQLLQQEERVAEMFELLDNLSDKKEEFFKKYKKEYPTEAIAFFRAEIEKNLKSTGDEYYRNIANYLIHLKELIGEEEVRFMAEKFKNEYKRRRNFVKILNNLGVNTPIPKSFTRCLLNKTL